MKCPVCNNAKVKRNCIMTGSQICSLCCGATRTHQTCHTCGYYKPEMRNYSKIPRYYPADMDGNDELADIASVIESAICTLDNQSKNTMTDAPIINIFERLLDLFHFNDDISNDADKTNVDFVLKRMHEFLNNIPNEEIVKIIGVLYFVAKRRMDAHLRTNHGSSSRAHMEFLQEYVGTTIRIADNSSLFKRLFLRKT